MPEVTREAMEMAVRAELDRRNKAGSSETVVWQSILRELEAGGWRTEQVSELRQDTIEACAQIADSFTCGGCGMDGKAGAAMRILAKLPLPSPPGTRDGTDK